MVNPFAPDLLAAFKLLKQVEPTAELIIHKTKQGSYVFSVKVKGRTRFSEQPAQTACEKICTAAHVRPSNAPIQCRPGISIFEVLQRERLQMAGFQWIPPPLAQQVGSWTVVS